MKLLHTADLHLGKILHNINLLEDQRHALGQILEMVQREQTDCVLISGDVYQNSVPSAEAQELFSTFLEQLVALHQQVFVISGNHDSGTRIRYLSPLVRQVGIHLAQRFQGTLQPIELRDEFGPITFHLLPFVRLRKIRTFYPEESLQTLEDGIRTVLAHSPMNPNQRNVLLCHQTVFGAIPCESEEQIIGTVEAVHATLFEGFDYVAMGHIHIPQNAGKATIRYAGTPLPYSFSEIKTEKNVTIVELGEKGQTEIRTLPILPLHPMEEKTGSFEEMLSAPSSENYLALYLTDRALPFDAGHQLRQHYPNLMKSIVIGRNSLGEEISLEPEMENKSLTDLYQDFCKLQGFNEPTEEELLLLEELLKKHGEESL